MTERERCPWCLGDALYQEYHDREWGVPEHCDRRLFEFLILEGAQAGLSWITVLRKRENYRQLMHQFDPEAIAAWGEPELTALMQEPGIIRNRRKLAATGKTPGPFCVYRKLSAALINISGGLWTESRCKTTGPRCRKFRRRPRRPFR